MTTTKTKGRAATYLRKSSVDGRSGDNRSFTRQMADIEKILSDYEIVAEFQERIGTSASHIANHDRPEWDKALAGLGYDYDVLIGSQIDRLSRQGISELVKIYEACEQGTGGRVLTTDWDSDSSEARILGPIIAELARAESTKLQERVLAGKKIQKDRREWLGGQAPFCWDITRDKSGEFHYQIKTDRQAQVIEIATQFVQGANWTDLGDYARARDWEMPNGKRHWKGGTAWLRILEHSSMLGQRIIDGEIVKDDDGVPYQFTEPVLPPALYARVKAEIIKRKTLAKRLPGRLQHNSALLSGFIVCATCNGKMTVHRPKRNTPGDHPWWYRCCDTYHLENDQQRTWTANAEEVNAVVSIEVMKLVGGLEPDSKLAAKLLRQVEQQINPSERTRRLEVDDNLIEVDDRLQTLNKKFLLGEIDQTQFNELQELATQTKRALLDELEELPPPATDMSVLLDWDSEAGPIGEGSLWASLNDHQKRDLISSLIERIEIDPLFSGQGRRRKDAGTKELADRIQIEWLHESNVTELKPRKPAANTTKVAQAS